MQDEVVFTVTPSKADRFCSWLIAMGGWAPSNLVEAPAVHRLIRTQNPDNKVGIPRQDVVVTMKEGSRMFTIRREFEALYQAWLTYDKAQYQEP